MTFTAADKAKCAEREVAQRRRVYPRLVESRRMKQAEADRQIAIMEAIAADYTAQADAEDAKLATAREALQQVYRAMMQWSIMPIAPEWKTVSDALTILDDTGGGDART